MKFVVVATNNPTPIVSAIKQYQDVGKFNAYVGTAKQVEGYIHQITVDEVKRLDDEKQMKFQF